MTYEESIKIQLKGVLKPTEIETLLEAIKEEVSLITDKTIEDMDKSKLPLYLQNKTEDQLRIDIAKLVMSQITNNIFEFTGLATEQAKKEVFSKTGEVPEGLNQVTEELFKKERLVNKWQE